MATKVAASYGRTSHERDDAFSIISQLNENRQYVTQHSIHLPPEYEFSEDYTGKVIDRPELNKIRQLIREGRINVLIVFSTDRFARKVGVGDFLLDELFAAGVELHIVAWNAPVRDTPEDRVRFNFEMTFSDFERRKIIERTSRGRLQKLTGSDGIPAAWLGQGNIDKYGFRKVGKKRTTRLEPVPAETEVIAEIFDLLVNEGRRVSEIVTLFSVRGTPTPSQAKGFVRLLQPEWHSGMIYHILRDECYTGVFYANQFQRVNGKMARRPRDEWIRLDFPELCIVDDETFQMAQQILDAGRSKYAFQPKHDYLMGRQMRCTCGAAIASRTSTRKSGLTHSYYGCQTRRDYRKGRCFMPNIRADFLDATVWDRLDRFLRNPQEQLETLRQAKATLEVQYTEALARLRECQATKDRCDQELRNYAELFNDGLITKDIMRDKKADLDKRLHAVEVVYREYEHKVVGNVLTDTDIRDIMTDLAELREELEQMGELSFAKRRRLIEAMHITGTIEIEENWQVIYISVYKTKIDRLVLQDMTATTC